MAPHAETAGQVQGVHGLGLELPKHRPAHSLQLLAQLVAELGTGARGQLLGCWAGVFLRHFAIGLCLDLQRRCLCAALLHLD